MLTRIVDDRRFAAVDLILVLACGVIAASRPSLGFWMVAVALLPVLLRLASGRPPVQRTNLDLVLPIFLLTSVCAWFVAYDREGAQEKLAGLLLAVLLFYALAGQPEDHATIVAGLFGGLGLLVTAYFFLTHDFVDGAKSFSVLQPVGEWLMRVRPAVGWPPIPSGHVPGLVILTMASVAPLWFSLRAPLARALILCLLGLLLITSVLTTSASVWVALFAALGACLLGWALEKFRPEKNRLLLPALILVYAFAITLALYIEAPAVSANPNSFGENNRLEVFVRSIFFLRDYPFTGAGLGSFAGQYSRYVLDIPYFYFSNSYNLFLDVAVEQGVIGGALILWAFLSIALRTAQRLRIQSPWDARPWVALFVLVFTVIHVLMQDYLYTGIALFMLLYPLGLAVFLTRPSAPANPMLQPVVRKPALPALAAVGLIVAAGMAATQAPVRSLWYSNVGALQLAQAELTGFPNTGWPGLGIAPKLTDSTASLQTSLQLDPENLTANYRLGLIHLLRQEFAAAEIHLARASALAPHHRGILKTLGYAKLWQGEVDSAARLLGPLPEIPNELDAYYSWWQEQGRPELADLAYALHQKLDQSPVQP